MKTAHTTVVGGSAGALYVADRANHRIRRVDPRDGAVSTVAGDGTAGYREGAAADARFKQPAAVAVASDGTIYVADPDNNRIRQISHGVVSTLAGSGEPSVGDGLGSRAAIRGPTGLHLDERHGLLYVATTHGSNLVRTVTVPSLGKRLFFPVIRLWSLAQTGRARLPPAPVEVTAREVRAREALRLLMNCPVEVLAAVLEYIFG